MASTSNSPSSALVTLPKRKNYYDVFVTFRGEDTRHNITDFLFEALKSKGISVFRDDTNLPKGESIRPELLRAIEDSHIFVAMFSKNYASSTWCLQELEKICECVQVSGKHVLPVFYDVDPSEVRKQTGIFGEAFVKHEQRFQQDSQISMVQRWRKSLTQVGTISGWDMRHKPQSAQIKEIVQRIINILDCKSSCVSKELVGMDSPIQELENHLLLASVDDVRAVGICGMGGIGKTTIATTLYTRISNQFGACCFVDDVNKVYRSHDGPLGLQKQIIHQTLSEEHHQLHNNHDAINLMQRRLGHVKTLLILDNVDHVKQLEIIPVNKKWLGAGSRIIIISRDEHILTKYGVDVVYRVPLLNETNSLELFCKHAFKLDHILNGYEGLVSSILHYTDSLPLAIEVSGSHLYNRNISEWGSALSRLRESPHKDVMDVLQLSFDRLQKFEKEIFLHIACFFSSRDEDYVKNVLNCCGFHADIGLRILVDKSLISIEDEKIKMHNLLEELGRKIVQENSNKDPKKWKRLWIDKQLYDVMSYNMEKHVEALVLDLVRHYNYKAVDDKVIIDEFSNLRLLIIKFVKISGNLTCLSSKLRYVEWQNYPFMYLPSNFQPNQLVELILDGSSIEQLWKGKKNLPNLRNLNLRGSKSLIKMPDFEEFPNLERLNLEGCIKLVKLDPSIRLLKKILYLNLKDCENLISIPNNIFGLSSLEYINMCGCSKVSFNNRRHLNIIESTSHSQSTSPSSSLTIPRFPLSHHTNLLHSLCSLSGLWEVDIRSCGLSQLPNEIGSLPQLERLHLARNNFVSLPNLNELSKLVYLNLEHCAFLESLPHLPFPTAIKGGLHCIDKLIGLHTFDCPKLGEKECRMTTLSWMTLMIQANPQFSSNSYDVIDLVIPGSEIPNWFNNQSEGDRILIDNSPIKNDISNDIIGFVCCSIFSLKPIDPISRPRSNLGVWLELHLTGFNLDDPMKKKGRRDHVKYLSVFYNEDHLITVKTNYIWLTYFPRKLSWYVPDFLSTMDVSTRNLRGGFSKMVEVKKCGYGWLHKQDLQEFNLTSMHPVDSLALKFKSLTIEDETQPQLHSFI